MKIQNGERGQLSLVESFVIYLHCVSQSVCIYVYAGEKWLKSKRS